jgi:hypothetical protein
MLLLSAHGAVGAAPCARARSTHASDRAPTALTRAVLRKARCSAAQPLHPRGLALQRCTPKPRPVTVLARAASSAAAPGASEPNVTVDVLREVAVLGVPILGAALSEPVRAPKARLVRKAS